MNINLTVAYDTRYDGTQTMRIRSHIRDTGAFKAIGLTIDGPRGGFVALDIGSWDSQIALMLHEPALSEMIDALTEARAQMQALESQKVAA